jgi:hypothetical protein
MLLRSGADTTPALGPGAVRAFLILGIAGIFISCWRPTRPRC